MVTPPIDPKLFPFLLEVKDPEIPVLNVIEMGIVRSARLEGETARITITPTYS
ncbi:MAG: phenylacetate-CoA oxygenase subunit PaaJ, partial [Pseudomonadota bacterium]